MTASIYAVCLLALTALSTVAAEDQQRTASGSKGLVVSGGAAATAAGIKMLEQGGNAADAGAAALLALSVTKVGAFCIGGEVPVLIYDAVSKEVKVLSGQGAAPLDPKAIEWYMKNGIPASDVRSAAVPAALDLIVTLLKLYGTMSFEVAVQPTLAILDAGGPSWYIDTGDGRRIETGHHWQAELAVTFRKLIEAERKAPGGRSGRLQAVADRFYRGDIADALERWYIEQGGFLRKTDLAAHKTRVEDPVLAGYRGYTVYKCGPWTQGPYLLETLRLLEGFDLKKMGFLSADYIHVVVEAMKLGLADRDEYYGDPLFVDVPVKALLSDEYTRIRRPLLDPSKASLEVRPGDPDHMLPLKAPRPTPVTPGGTTTLCVADRWGNVIAATPSGLSSTAGVAGDTGIIHGSRLVSLNTWKGHPNRIQPGKRPRVTLTPTLVLKDGKPVLAISVAGGDLQDQAAIQLILNYVEFGMLPERAVSEPRFATTHHTGSFGQDKPILGSLQVNVKIPESVRDELKMRGHVLTTARGGIGGVNMLYLDPKSNVAFGAGPAAGRVSSLALSAQPVPSRPELYVSLTGDDSSPGTIQAPWRTIQHAADTASAGSTVNVRGGRYGERITINVSGNPRDGYVTFRSSPGETAILDGERLTPDGRSALLVIQDKSYVRIEGFEIRNYRTDDRRRTPMGISVRGSGSHIELLHNNVHHIEQTFSGRDAPGRGANAFGIAVYGTDAKTPITDLLIDGNQVHHLKTGSSESLVVNGNVMDFRITHNVVHDNNNIGIDVIGFERTAPDPAVDQARDGVVSDNLVCNITSKGNPAYGNDQSSDGIYVDGGTRVLIERNKMHHVDFGIELASEHRRRTSSYVTVRNNLIYACNTAGISIGGYGAERGGTDHCTVINNTLYGNDTANTGSGEFQMQFNMTNNVFEKNIVYAGSRCLLTSSKSGPLSGTPTVSMDYNVYYCDSGAEASKWGWSPESYLGFASYVKASGNDQHSRFVDPRFMDLSKDDFHVQAGSPAVNAGCYQGR